METLKLLFFSLLALFLSSNAAAQTDLTQTQLQEFNRQKLTLDLRGVGMGSYGSGSISYSSWTKWDAQQGFKRISEIDFYSLAGYEDLATQARKRKKLGNILAFGGLGMAIGGIPLATSENSTVSILGLVAIMGGLVGGYASIGIVNSNLQPYGVASGIADEYNSQLMVTIKKRF